MIKTYFEASQISKSISAKALSFGKQFLANAEKNTESMVYSHNIAHGVYTNNYTLGIF